MKLHYAPRSRYSRPRWLLEELEVPYGMVRVNLPTTEPTLEDDGVVLWEPSALCLVYLADRFPEKKLAPPIGSDERRRYYQWLSFTEGTLEPRVLEFYPD